METTLQNNEGDVRVSAAVALDQQRKLTEVGRQILVDAMKNHNGPYTAALRGNVARALGEQPTLSELEQAILEAALQDSEAEVRVHAAVALTQHRKLTGAGRHVLVDAVKNHNGTYTALLRGNAAWALGEQSTTLSELEQTALKIALQDSEADVRVRAAVALNQHRKSTEAARQVLVDAVKNHNGPYTALLRGNAVWALGEQATLSELEQTALETALQDSEADMRVRAAVALNQHRKLTEAGRQVLVEAVKNHNGSYTALFRGNAAWALGEQATLSESEQTALKIALQDSEADVRVRAAVALHKHRKLTEAGRQVLVEVVKNHNRPYTALLRGNAAWALGEQATLSESEQTALKIALQDSEADVRVRAAVALHKHRKLTEAARQVLVDAVKNHNGPYTAVLRDDAAWALGEQSTLSESEQAILEAALQDNEPDVRVRAAVALHKHRKLTEAGRQVLVDAVKNHNGPYTAVRRDDAAWALGEQTTLSESEQAILEAALQDSEADVRVRAAVALHEHRKLTEAGRQVLVDAVKNHNGPYTAVRRDDAAWALGEQPTLSESEQAILEAALQDNEADVRVRAAVALHEHRKLTEAARQVLVEAVKNHKGPYTAVRRGDAAWALGEQSTLSESEQAILEAALQDNEPDVRVRAAVALHEHRKLTEAERQVLVEAIKNHKGPYTAVRRGGAAWALGEQPTLSESEQATLEAALQDNQADVRVRAAVALHEHRKLTEAGRQVLVEAVKNHNGPYTVLRRDDAAWALGEQATLSESEQAILEAALQDSEADVRVRAAVALSKQHKLTEAGRQVLVDAVKNHNGPYAISAAWALGEQATLSESEQTILEAALQDNEADMRACAAVALSRHRQLTEAGRQVLVEAVKNHNGPYTAVLRSDAAWALGEQSTLSESEQAILEAALQDSEADVRVRAAVALSRHRQLTEAGRQVLVEAVKNHNGPYAISAAWALGEQATLSESEQTILETALQDNEANMRACAAVALSRHRQLTEAGRQVLVEAVKSHNGPYTAVLRGNTAWALGEQPTLSESEQTALEAALQDSEADVRVRAAIALSRHRKFTETGRQVLVEAVKNHDGPYAISAAWALGEQATLSESEQAILKAALQDNEADMRACAAVALSRHRKLTEAGRRVLVDAVKNHNGPYAISAARALGEQATLSESEQTILEAALQDNEADMRACAAVALSKQHKLTEAGRQVLVEAVKNHDGPYAISAAWALGEQSTLSESEQTILEATLQDNEADMRACAAVALSRHRKFTETGRQVLVEAVKNHDGPYAISAAWALGEQATLSESEQAILKAALQDNEADMRACAAVALSRHRKLTEAGRRVLVEAVKNHNGPYTAALRGYAAWALGEQTTLSEPEQAILKIALQDSEEDVRVRAAVALDQHRKLTEFSYLIH